MILPSEMENADKRNRSTGSEHKRRQGESPPSFGCISYLGFLYWRKMRRPPQSPCQTMKVSCENSQFCIACDDAGGDFHDAVSAPPVVLGLSNKHPLSESQVGELLLDELRCGACHSRKDASLSLERAAPDLSDVGSRVAPEFLRRFIASPSASHSGTTMPDLLSAESADQRDKIAEAITQFLIAQSPRKFQRQAIDEHDASVGKALFHTIGCIACHSPRDESGKETTHEGVVELGHIPAKYSLASLAEFLFQPMHVRPSGRMPDMKLTPAEAKAIASYLLGKADAATAPLPPDANLVALGKTVFPTIQLRRLSQTRRYSGRGIGRSFRRNEFDARLPVQNAGQKSAIQPERRPNPSNSLGALQSHPSLLPTRQ